MTAEAKSRLVEHYLPVVKYHAERLRRTLPNGVELDDLEQDGAIGLGEAIDKFNPDLGVKFETYAATRIRGAMLDGLRAMDWVPRLVRHRTDLLHRLENAFVEKHGHKPTFNELQQMSGMSVRAFRRIFNDKIKASVSSLNVKRFETDDAKDVSSQDLIVDNRVEQPDEVVANRESFASIIRSLTRAERLIIILYYDKEMTMKEIGATIDLSESRVSQMHTSILARLKSRLTAAGITPAGLTRNLSLN